MSEPRRKSSRLTWILTGAVVAVLVVVAVAALVPGLRQAQVIDEIEAHGGLITFETTFPDWLDKALSKACGDRHNRMFGRITSAMIEGDWFGDAELQRAGGFRDAESLYFHECALSGGLEILGPNPNLRTLYLGRTKLVGDGLNQLPALPNLEELLVWGSPGRAHTNSLIRKALARGRFRSNRNCGGAWPRFACPALASVG